MWIGDRLALGRLTDNHLVIVRKCDDRRGGAITFRIFDYAGLVPFHDRNTRIRRAKVDADYGTHDFQSFTAGSVVESGTLMRGIPFDALMMWCSLTNSIVLQAKLVKKTAHWQLSYPLFRHHHQRWPYESVIQRVTLLHDRGDRIGCFAFDFLHRHRLMKFRIKFLIHRVDL